MKKRGWMHGVALLVAGAALGGCVTNQTDPKYNDSIARNANYGVDGNLASRSDALAAKGLDKLSKEELSEYIGIHEELFRLKPVCQVCLNNTAVGHAWLDQYDQAAQWFEKLYLYLKTNGVVLCGGGGLSEASYKTAEYYYKAQNDGKAMEWAKLAVKHATELGDDQPTCERRESGALHTKDDGKVRKQAKELLDKLESIPLRSNPLTMMAHGPADKAYINSIGLELIYIPPGSFQMGDDASTAKNEKPAHEVILERGFYLGKSDVTQAQWFAVMGSVPSAQKGGTRPVTDVNWHDAQDFIRKLNKKENTTLYRLPSEAEWEYAVRAGTKTDYFFGQEATLAGQYGWYGDNAGKLPHPVATRHPNPWGLYDMVGNVYQWVADCGVNTYENTPRNGEAQRNTPCVSYSVRGASYTQDADWFRSAKRGFLDQDKRQDNVGFRLAMSMPSQDKKKMGNPANSPAKKAGDALFGAGAFVPVPGGPFQMGHPEAIVGKTVHAVTVKAFEIGKYEVTQGQWQAVMGNNPSKFADCGEDCPVESVSWHDVQEFIDRLNERKDGCTYRLPTEAEWEYACRSGGKDEKYCGGNALDPVAWHKGNSLEKTHKVGMKEPNGLGLYDMSGNVWEWVFDWFDENYYANSPRDNPQGPPWGINRVLRGGGWTQEEGYARSALRNGVNKPSIRFNDLGVRLVRNCP